MSKVKHIQFIYELPIGTRFTLDTWPDKTFEVVKVEDSKYERCDDCFFCGGHLVEDGYIEDCETHFRCDGKVRKDKTDVVFEEVKE